MATNAERALDDLPHALGTFIGRAHETAEIVALLATARLFTLTGTGGSGKTRLAVHVASQVRDACTQWVPDGVRWVAQLLAALPEPTPTRAHLLWVAGILARPDAMQAQQQFMESLALWQMLGDRDRTARVLASLGFVAQALVRRQARGAGAPGALWAWYPPNIPLSDAIKQRSISAKVV